MYTVENIINSLKTINEKIWIAGFSGGKDSSLLVDILVEAVSRYRRGVRLHVIYADTLIEYPQIRDYAYLFLRELSKYGRVSGLDINVYIVYPDKGKDILSLQLDRGYPTPHRKFRWCTEKFKIIPARRVINNIIKGSKNGGVAVFNGSRFDESAYRSGVMKKKAKQCKDCIDPVSGASNKYVRQRLRLSLKKIGESFTGSLPLFVVKSSGLGGARIYNPLAYLTEDDVWSIIRSRRRPFFTDIRLYDELLKLYGKLDPPYRSEDKVRFGCWLCTVITVDKSGKYLSKIYPEIGILVWARKALYAISHEDKDLLRNKGRFPRQRYDGLNEEGLELTKAVYHVVYTMYPEAFKSYIENREYTPILDKIKTIDYEKVLKIINNVVDKTSSEELRNILLELKDKIIGLKK